MSEHPSLDYATVILRNLEVANQEAMSPVMLRDTEWYTHVEVAGRNIMLGLRAYVLSEDGGDPVEARAYYWQKIKPRWLPNFLWRRIPEQRETTVQTATPLWTYPQATISVPDLGPAIAKVLRT